MRYETTTSLDPNAALLQAEDFFRAEFGLTLCRRGPRDVTFEGGGGHVAIAVQTEVPTTLDLETREWDTAVREFMKRLPR